MIPSIYSVGLPSPKHLTQSTLPPNSYPLSVTGMDQVQFGAKTTKKKDSDEKLGFIKNTIRKIMTLLLRLIPKSFIRWVEGKTIFAGQGDPRLKTDLKSLKNAKTDDETIQRIQETRFKSSKGIENLAWHIPAKDEKPTLLLSMGNYWSINGIIGFQQLLHEGYGLMAYEYPGYGSTGGKCSEETVTKSLEAASKYLEEQGVPKSQQILYGISIGGGPTVEVATKSSEPYKAVILESTYTSLPDVTKTIISRYIPWWLFPIHTRLQTQFNSIDKIPKLTCPLLVLHGIGDPLIPSRCGMDLYDKAGTPDSKKEFEIYGVNEHNLSQDMTAMRVDDFIKRL